MVIRWDRDDPQDAAGVSTVMQALRNLNSPSLVLGTGSSRVTVLYISDNRLAKFRDGLYTATPNDKVGKLEMDSLHSQVFVLKSISELVAITTSSPEEFVKVKKLYEKGLEASETLNLVHSQLAAQLRQFQSERKS